MTDPITGTQVTVPAIAGMAKASDLDALAKLSGETTSPARKL
jgi:hypothetical protein